MSIPLLASNFKNRPLIGAFDSGSPSSPKQSAKWLAALGIPVLPLNDNKRPYSNAMIANILGIADPDEGQGGCKLATTDQASIDKLWTALPNARIGIRTGKASGLYVLDIDRKNGKDGFASIIANGFELPHTQSESTASGGAHYYYRIPKDDQRHWKNDSGILGIGIDRKGDNGYVAWNGANLSQQMALPPVWMINDLGIERPIARRRLGDPSLAAPTLEAAIECLNSLDATEREDWLKRAAKFKQAVATRTSEDAAYFIFDQWSRKSGKYDAHENKRQWDSIRDTEGGWDSLRKEALRCGDLTDDQRGRMMLGAPTQTHPSQQQQPLSSFQQIEENAFATLVLMGTHADTATAFAIKHKEQFLYNASRKQWLQWDGKRWSELQPEAMLGNIRHFCTSVINPEIKRPRTLNFWQGVLTTLTTMPDFLRDQKQFDADNYALNTPIGTIDLRTGIINRHNPADNITSITNAAPTPISADWKQFVSEITSNDQETASTLQIMLGASLSGAIEEHWIGFLWGNGRNGKSALIEAIAYALGDYAKQVPSEVFASNKHEQHPTGLTTLIGGRFTFANEVKEGTYFDTSVLKTVSGDEQIKARYMQGNFFSFKRTFKLFLIGNDLPQIRTQDIAIKTRLRIVPFRAKFAGKEDRELPMKLRANAGAVLQWLLDGHKAWIEAGKRLTTSGAIEHATAAYFAAQSTPEMWLAERARIINPDVRPVVALPTAGAIYDDYAAWKRGRGEQGISQTKLGTWLAMQSGIEKVSSNYVRYRGVELVAHLAPPMPGQVVPFQR